MGYSVRFPWLQSKCNSCFVLLSLILKFLDSKVSFILFAITYIHQYHNYHCGECIVNRWEIIYMNIRDGQFCYAAIRNFRRVYLTVLTFTLHVSHSTMQIAILTLPAAMFDSTKTPCLTFMIFLTVSYSLNDHFILSTLPSSCHVFFFLNVIISQFLLWWYLAFMLICKPADFTYLCLISSYCC